MVAEEGLLKVGNDQLSVLALSSRFDGHREWLLVPRLLAAFSTRSVESF